MITTNKLGEAVGLACTAHSGQMYQNNPYAAHCHRVAERVKDMGYVDDAYLIVAWLHDVVEDTDVTLDTITKEFGVRIASAVDAITRRKWVNGMGIETKESEEDYLFRVMQNHIAATVKFADMLDNLMMTQAIGCPENKRKLWKKYVNAAKVLSERLDTE